MPSNLDGVVWELDETEPTVVVDPSIEAFCVVPDRAARGTTPPSLASESGALPLETILLFMSMSS